jgi:hypothetical protein
MKQFESAANNRGPEDERLDALFREYRQVCEPHEANPNFMPELWRNIEAKQSATFSFQRIARAFVTVGAALTLILATYELVPHSNSSAAFNATYVETLADQSDTDVIAVDFVEEI